MIFNLIHRGQLDQLIILKINYSACFADHAAIRKSSLLSKNI
ncbi:MAG: hypothetical protein OFPI_44270 [Osedax symbiont Rs2]|nr:MAG: hypothetical protein OFPI_44270 [Osedax symbiont Rs2]